MEIFRAVKSGAIVWSLVFSSFLLASILPILKDSEIRQGIIVGILLIPFAWIGAALYYKKGVTTNGFTVGLIMVSTALILDALITVPYVMIPLNGSYSSFFTNPILWILVAENVAVNYFYWKVKVLPASAQ